MTLDEILALDVVKQEPITVDTLYRLEVLENITDNTLDLFKIERNKEKFRDIIENFLKKTYHRGNIDDVELTVLFYDNKPVLIYEVYKNYTYWHINILDQEFYQILTKLIILQIELEYQGKMESGKDELEWLNKYYIVQDKSTSSEIVDFDY